LERAFTRIGLLNKFYGLIAKATNHMEKLEIREYVQTVFFDALSLIDKYRDMVGDEYVCGVRRILRDWITVLNPVIPHITEEINTWLGNTDLLSTSKWPTPPAIDEEIIILVDSVESTIEDIKELAGLVRKESFKVYIIIAPEWKREIAKMTIENTPLKTIIEHMRSTYSLRGREAEIAEAYSTYKKVDREVLSRITKTTSRREREVYTTLSNYIKSKIPGIQEVIVLWEDEARNKGIPKAERALPLKPALYIE